MNIARRLTLLLAVPLAGLAGLAVFAHFELAELADRGQDLAGIQIPTLAVIGNVTRAYGELRVYARDYILADNETRRAEVMAQFLAREAEMNRLLDQYAATKLVEDEDRRLLTEYRRLAHDAIQQAKQVMAVAAGGNRPEALVQFETGLRELAVGVNRASQEWIQHNERAADQI